jgi:iron(III) transport system permease protein
VGLPLARPAIVAGMALAMMETLADFGTVAYFGVPTFSTGIYRAVVLARRSARGSAARARHAAVRARHPGRRARVAWPRAAARAWRPPSPAHEPLRGAAARSRPRRAPRSVLLGFAVPAAILYSHGHSATATRSSARASSS